MEEVRTPPRIAELYKAEDIRKKKWDLRFLDVAEMVASWSKDPSTKCGAVIVRPDMTIASVGYNGFPRGCADDETIYKNRELKYERVIHAEVNAILNAREVLTGYTIYTYPKGYGPSCARCTTNIIQSGIKRVVHLKDTSEFAERWKVSAEIGLDMYREAGVEVYSIFQIP